MSWNRKEKKWEAITRAYAPSLRKKRIGWFVDEGQAARAVDQRRKEIVGHGA